MSSSTLVATFFPLGFGVSLNNLVMGRVVIFRVSSTLLFSTSSIESSRVLRHIFDRVSSLKLRVSSINSSKRFYYLSISRPINAHAIEIILQNSTLGAAHICSFVWNIAYSCDITLIIHKLCNPKPFYYKSVRYFTEKMTKLGNMWAAFIWILWIIG